MDNKKNTIVDVRTPQEFMDGHVPGTINIPLNEITQRLDEIKALPQPITLICASGNRSGQATTFLKSCGVDCANGGSWMSIKSDFQTV